MVHKQDRSLKPNCSNNNSSFQVARWLSKVNLPKMPPTIMFYYVVFIMHLKAADGMLQVKWLLREPCKYSYTVVRKYFVVTKFHG